MSEPADRIAALEARVAELESENERLETRVEKLKVDNERLRGRSWDAGTL